MYENFFGLTKKPFTLIPDPDFLYMSGKHAIALSLLEYSLTEQAGTVVIAGEIGSGKTTLVRYLLKQHTQNLSIGLLSNTHRSIGDNTNELLQWVLLAFGINHKDKDKIQLYQTFNNFLRDNYASGKKAVLIVDEAHNLKPEVLEELRLLSNMNIDNKQLLQLILVGQPQLRDLLKLKALEQFSQRVTMDYFIEPLTLNEAKQYIQHRLKLAGAHTKIFSQQAIGVIIYYSAGVPRLINILCDTALLYAFAEQKRLIDVELVREVVKDRLKGQILPIRSRNPNVPAAVKLA